jgi:SAM-dependent methyltransferase|tara:strand:- start:303 stop:962 length:660 start_codon:yes stop_codon:yes gene_type:complete
MGKEIDLLAKYPKTKRDLTKRLESKSEEVRSVARKFGKEFFDGERKFGYGGFSYDPKYWSEVVKDFSDYYNLGDGSKILDIGCGKGFMIYDFLQHNNKYNVKGIDISNYAIENSMPEVKGKLEVGDAKKLNFEDNSFDLVIAINTIHNLEKEECGKSLREIERVSKKNKFIVVDAYKNDEEKKRMFAWNLTGKTIMHVDEWKIFFKENGYTGDHFWFTP